MDEPKSQSGSATEGSAGRDRVHTLVLLVGTGLGVYLCYRLALPFLAPLTWALALAVLFVPSHRWVETRIKHPSVAALISVLIIGVIVVVPVTFVAERLITEAAKGAERVRGTIESGEWRGALETHPRIARLAGWLEQQVDLSGALQNIGSWLTNTGASVVRGSVLQFVGLLLTFYLLFYFLRDRSAALEALRTLSPLSADEMRRLFQGVADSVLATIYGTVVVAAVQGALGGLMFWWLGLPAPLLWGLVMGLLAIVPVLGAFVVWIPAALVLGLQGNWGKALILTAWGGVVVAGIDNLLYPILVGNRLKMHTVLAFISVVGGLVVFGASGLVLGPIAVTSTRLLLEIWRARLAAPTPAVAT